MRWLCTSRARNASAPTATSTSSSRTRGFRMRDGRQARQPAGPPPGWRAAGRGPYHLPPFLGIDGVSMHARTATSNALAALAALSLAAGCDTPTTMRTTNANPPAAGAPDAGRDILPFEATETTLANGLKVIVLPTG